MERMGGTRGGSINLMFAVNGYDFSSVLLKMQNLRNDFSDSVPSVRFWRPLVPKSQSDFPFMAQCNTHTAHQGSHWGQQLSLSMHELSSGKEQCSKFIEQDEDKMPPLPPVSLLNPHCDTEKLYFIANVQRHKRPIWAWNPRNGLLSNMFFCFPVNSSCSDSSSVGSQKEGGSPASGRDPRRSSGSTSYSQVEWTRAQWCNDAKGHVVTRPQLHEKPLPETVLMERTWNVRCLFRNTKNVENAAVYMPDH